MSMRGSSIDQGKARERVAGGFGFRSVYQTRVVSGKNVNGKD